MISTNSGATRIVNSYGLNLSHKDNTAEEHAYVHSCVLGQVQDISFIRGNAVGYGGYDTALVWTCYSKNIRVHGLTIY